MLSSPANLPLGAVNPSLHMLSNCALIIKCDEGQGGPEYPEQNKHK